LLKEWILKVEVSKFLDKNNTYRIILSRSFEGKTIPIIMLQI